MRIGLFDHGWWEGACRARNLETIRLPVGTHASGNVHQANLAARIESATEAQAVLDGKPIDLLLDNGGTGLGFVSNPDRENDLLLFHETVERRLVSHFIDPLVTALQGLAWPAIWQCLQSPHWIKAVWDRAQVDELKRFGVPHVIHLPMAAPCRPYCVEPLDPKEIRFQVSFVGAQNTSYFRPGVNVPTASLFSGTLAHAPSSTGSVETFASLYFDRYGIGRNLQASDTLQTQLQTTLDYFNHKLYFNAAQCIQNRDRFVIFLKKNLDHGFHLIGRGWQEAYGIAAEQPLAAGDAYFEHFRQTAINLNFVNGNSETGLNMRHFEITAAGGFMLCSDRGELSDCFEIGKECATFSDEDDLLVKIDYFLTHPEERMAIARAGQQRTLTDHLYVNRLATVLDYVAKLPAATGAAEVPVAASL